MRMEISLLERLSQTNKIFNIQLRIGLDDLLSVNASSSDDPETLPIFVFESTKREQELVIVGSDLNDDMPRKVIVFNRMLLLVHPQNGKKNIYPLRENGCTIHVDSELIIRLQFSQDEYLKLECTSRAERQRYLNIFRSVLEPTFFDSQTTQTLAQHIRQSNDQPQSYYAIPLEELRSYPRCTRWQVFEEVDSPKNIQYSKDQEGEYHEVIAATLPKLIQKLTSPTIADNQLLYAFLLTYRSFTTPEELIDLLIDRYNTPPPPAYEKDMQDFNCFKEQLLFPMRLRICQVLKHWIDHHAYDLREDAKTRRALAEFIEGHIAKSLEALADSLRIALQRESSFFLLNCNF